MGERDTVMRWQRRYGEQRFVFAFSEFTVSDMLPGTIVYQRLALAIALQRLWHALRPDLYRLTRARRPAPPSEPAAEER